MIRPGAVEFRVYLITDRTLVSSIGLVDAVAKALDGGVRAVQLREKDLGVRELCRFAEQLRVLTEGYSARLYINDRADVAAGIGADGVHLTTISMPIEAVREAFGDRLSIGVSTHSLDELRRAAVGGADFVTFSPVFDTPSKRVCGPPLGLAALERAVGESVIPVFALGGVTQERISDIMNTGCHGVALISGILGAPDIRREAESFTRKLL